MDNELLCLLRQFRHNNSDEFVSGFDRDGVIALVSGLRAELAECKRDAERYRWLRKQHWNTSKFAVVCDPKNSIKLGYDSPSLERLDDLIDSELLQAQT